MAPGLLPPRSTTWPTALGIGLLCAGNPLLADEPAVRHGAVLEDGAAVKGALTATVQHADNQDIDTEVLSSFDLLTTLPTASGRWLFYLEGSTTPADDGVSATLHEANADAGTALDRDGKGRLQVSEVNYRWRWTGHTLTLGLIDASGYLDISNLANDETTQFLGTHFVNNPTIAFPDYTLGAALHHSYQGQVFPGFTLFMGSSHGLGDNAERSYAALLDVDASDKGVFGAGEIYWQGATTTLRLGLWQNSGDHARLDGLPGMASNRGIYAVVDTGLGDARLNLRLGQADETVAEASAFVALAIEHPVGGVPTGLGLAQTRASDELDATRSDSRQAELYMRFRPYEGLRISPSLQYIRNSGLIDDNADHWVTGLRISYGF
ncbi:MAG: carbohydrate porin [Chromatiales bacterium]|nr:carbohydrate porin [Chromatiales bacterium]